MTKLTLEQQELLFANDCKLINLRYEYHGYTGTEKWAIVTELAEEELWLNTLMLSVGTLRSFCFLCSGRSDNGVSELRSKRENEKASFRTRI